MLKLQRILLESYECRTRGLGSCVEFMAMLEATLEVTEVGRLQIKVTSPIEGRPGVSLVAVFLESNMAIHTFPEVNYADLYISCCKPFNRDKVIKAFRYFFNVSDITEVL